ncbi:MAG TPA: single-stranded-DNA-specific exonuclease RecJ [Bacteroidales bacterium]|nr:single-stranded-DNA-specific exonuclease RecJ [Bacteroidales bacterium]OQB63344.1 MAG: Single-stranded-DNA-specific exonuclease RecJ [Bacteroidetes bacterium ADurb.Bin145]HOU01776.1 single-stranded-DNA-specific exonuclease RecJ [Bacteroidales bacterium]HQG62298.1 single-stranded-DNA-specific exonuclease RecJ [Bacteroidales bacterium]HQK68183.1 single-stranded-DNA-specific exonuclease RecJ [Bacteroidales bacterium]
MEKKWVIKERGDSGLVKQLAGDLGVSESLANLMVQRKITTPGEARKFFNPSLDYLHDPFLMKDMNRAVDRLSGAIKKGEKILVYGDYDVDGTTAVALVYSFLKKNNANVDYYIPDRYKEGYGVSFQGIDFAFNNNFKVVISLDCGIKAVEKIQYAKSKGLDVIICDHHYPGDEIPKALAVLDPKQPGCDYPYKELSGCGVGFKLIHAYSKIHSIPFSEIANYLDLVAVSIASDIVPITGENRVLAYFGLKQLNEAPRTGLKEIIREAEVSRVLTIEDVVFKIGPRINAAGRMETGSKAVELLISDDPKVAAAISKEINCFNIERRNIDRSITTEAMRMISENQRSVNSKTTVLFNPQWKKGVIGIVASRLIETYYRPTVILTESNGFATGSARSVQGYDLYQAIEACSDLLESFGGHMFAAGLTLKKENIEPFIERFEQFVNSTITEDQLSPRIFIDTELAFSEINEEFYRVMSQFQPYGPENMSPIFISYNVFDSGSGRMVGSSGEHLKLDLCQDSGTFRSIPAIAFGQADYFEYIKNGKPFDVCYSVEMNEFRGNRNLQLNIRDIKTRS